MPANAGQAGDRILRLLPAIAPVRTAIRLRTSRSDRAFRLVRRHNALGLIQGRWHVSAARWPHFASQVILDQESGRSLLRTDRRIDCRCEPKKKRCSVSPKSFRSPSTGGRSLRDVQVSSTVEDFTSMSLGAAISPQQEMSARIRRPSR